MKNRIIRDILIAILIGIVLVWFLTNAPAQTSVFKIEVTVLVNSFPIYSGASIKTWPTFEACEADRPEMIKELKEDLAKQLSGAAFDVISSCQEQK